MKTSKWGKLELGSKWNFFALIVGPSNSDDGWLINSGKDLRFGATRWPDAGGDDEAELARAWDGQFSEGGAVAELCLKHEDGERMTQHQIKQIHLFSRQLDPTEIGWLEDKTTQDAEV